MRTSLSVCSVLMVLQFMPVAVGATGQGGAAFARSEVRGDAASADRVRAPVFQVLTVPESPPQSLDVQVSFGRSSHTLHVEQHSIRSQGYRVLVEGSDGGPHDMEPPPPRTYRGRVEGIPTSRVAVSVAGGMLYATILLETDTIWSIEPVHKAADAPPGGITHMAYRKADLIPGSWQCGAGLVSVPDAIQHAVGDVMIGREAGTDIAICDVAFDADTEFFRANGWSIENTVFDIENVTNAVALIYENEVNITYEISTIVVRTDEPDPYDSTNSVDLLFQFRNEWNGYMRHIHRDIAHLMTGKEIDGNVIGSAYTGHICEMCAGAYGYAFSQSRFSPLMLERTFLTAHEIGHNWGADHCDLDTDCAIMCSQIGGCSGSYTEFGEASSAAINSTAAVAPCLTVLASPAVFPFCETFESGINNGNWNYNAIAEISADALAPPSPPYALLIDNCCTECAAAPDEIRSTEIQLGAIDTATLLYHTQHAGGIASTASQLVVEYRNDNLAWIELNRVYSNGIDQTAFDAWSHSLPLDALHDEFRIRFRLEPVSDFDLWYLDNVAIVSVIPDSSVLYVDGSATGAGSGTSWETAYTGLQDALIVSACLGSAMEEIWVREGTYTPDLGTGDRNAAFRLRSGLAVLGGFSGDETSSAQRNPQLHRTILSGDIGIFGYSPDNSYHVVTAEGTDATATLDGFEITGGVANATPTDGGAGVRIVGGSPSIIDCVIRGNTGGNGGGGYISSGAPDMLDTVFIANFASLSGGGLYAGSDSMPAMTNSLFLGNSAGAFGGALYSYNSDSTLVNCLFSGNTASSGGAVYAQLGGAALTNCTLSTNAATGSVGGVLAANSSAVLKSCILWGNTDNGATPETAQVNGAIPVVDYTCIEGWTGALGGRGNTGQDPLLTDPDGPDGIVGTIDDDVRLLSESPVIDAGDPGLVTDPGAIDLDGVHRILCGRVDMGPYEFGAWDFDCNRSVGPEDFAGWPECMTGPADGTLVDGCKTLDSDVDDDVDLRDFSRFQNLPFDSQ